MKAARLFNIALNIGGIIFSIIGLICIAKFAFGREWQVNRLDSEVATLGKVEELQPVSGRHMASRQAHIDDLKSAIAELNPAPITATKTTSIVNEDSSLSPRPFKSESPKPSANPSKIDRHTLETEQKLLSKAEKKIESTKSRVLNVGFNRIDPVFGQTIASAYLKHLGFNHPRNQTIGTKSRISSNGNFGESRLSVSLEWDSDRVNPEAKLQKIATQSVSIVVNPNNPIDHLSMKQLAEIISGRATQWRTVGGKDSAIDLVAVGNAESELTNLLNATVLHKSKYSLKAKKFTFAKAADALNNAATGQGVLAFIPSELVDHSQVKTLAISADSNTRRVLPNQVTINTLDYPLARHKYLELPEKMNKFTQGLIEFINSEEGQQIGNKLGYTMLNTELSEQKLSLYQKHIQSLADDKRILPAYRQIFAKGDRLDTQFNLAFNYGEMELTDESKTDLNKLATWLIRNQISSQVIFLGFTDSVGRSSDNKNLSQKRAQVAADYLKGRGFENSLSIGLGEEMPTGDNSLSEGRARNRRVEIWLVRDLPKIQ